MSLRVPSGEFVSGRAFLEACKTGGLGTVEKTATLWWRMFNQTTLNEGLACAAQEGQTDVVRGLLKWANPRYDTDRSLRMASRERHIECVKLLLPYVPANTCDNVCVWGALRRGGCGDGQTVGAIVQRCSPQ